MLDDILMQDLANPQPHWLVENDAMDVENPVLFGYTCDMPRIKRFSNGVNVHGLTGTLYCFDFQENAMRQICGSNVDIQCIDFEALEKLL